MRPQAKKTENRLFCFVLFSLIRTFAGKIDQYETSATHILYPVYVLRGLWAARHRREGW